MFLFKELMIGKNAHADTKLYKSCYAFLSINYHKVNMGGIFIE